MHYAIHGTLKMKRRVDIVKRILKTKNCSSSHSKIIEEQYKNPRSGFLYLGHVIGLDCFLSLCYSVQDHSPYFFKAGLNYS